MKTNKFKWVYWDTKQRAARGEFSYKGVLRRKNFGDKDKSPIELIRLAHEWVLTEKQKLGQVPVFGRRQISPRTTRLFEYLPQGISVSRDPETGNINGLVAYIQETTSRRKAKYFPLGKGALARAMAFRHSGEDVYFYRSKKRTSSI